MKKLLLSAILAFTFFSAFADYVAVQGDDYVVARDVPCFPTVLKQIEDKKMPVPVAELRGGVARVDGKSYQLCWFQKDDLVGVIFDDGDVGVIPVANFKPSKEA